MRISPEGNSTGIHFVYSVFVSIEDVASSSINILGSASTALANDINCLASGGNDNLLCLWHLNGTSQSSDVDSSSCNNVIFPRVCFTQHKAAIRALAWCPYQRNVLVSGGGTKDKSIKMWNTATSTLISSYDTSSQVCNVMFNKYEKELISTHGYSKNQICIWSYPKMKKICF